MLQSSVSLLQPNLHLGQETRNGKHVKECSNPCALERGTGLEGLFAESIEKASRLRPLNDGQQKLLERVDQACQELYLPEVEHYIAHKYNEETPRVLTKYDLMGLTVPLKYEEQVPTR